MAPRSLDLRSLRIDMKSLADRLLESPMLKEASMSYCAFENTATDMAQVVGMIKNIIRSDDPAAEFKAHFNKYELRGMSSLKQLCRQYLEDVARMEAEVKERGDDYNAADDHDMGGDFPPERD